MTGSGLIAGAAGGVEVSRDGPVLRVVLNDPSTRNALSPSKLAIVRAALDMVADDTTFRVVVLAGAAGVFCSGWDIRPRSGSDPAADHSALLAAYTAVATCRVPVIAQVDGAAIGAAVGLVGASDLAVAGDAAIFCLPEPGLGLVAFPAMLPCLGRWRLADATRYLLTGERFTGAQAAAAGLVTCAVPADDVPDAVGAMIASVLAGSPSAIVATKRTLRRLTDGQPGGQLADAAELANLVDPEDAAEGAAARREGRPPSWVPLAPSGEHLRRGENRLSP